MRKLKPFPRQQSDDNLDSAFAGKANSLQEEHLFYCGCMLGLEEARAWHDSRAQKQVTTERTASHNCQLNLTERRSPPDVKICHPNICFCNNNLTRASKQQMRFSHGSSASDLRRFGFSTAPAEEGLIITTEVSAKDMGLNLRREFTQSHAAGRQDGYDKKGGKKDTKLSTAVVLDYTRILMFRI